MMLSTQSPQLSREEQLSLWREQKQKKPQTPKIRDNMSSTGVNSNSGGARSSESASQRRHQISHRARASFEASSAFKTPYGGNNQDNSPLVVPARLSSNVSCRKPRLPRQHDMSTTSSRLKQRSLKSREETLSTPQDSYSEARCLSYRPRKSLSAEQYLSNRPCSLFSIERSAQKENSGASLVNKIRSRAAKKREQDEDESSKLESRATTYRTPLSYGASVATAQNENALDPDGILDISISLPFKDLLSPLSATSVAVSPASTISTNKVVNEEEPLADASQSMRQQVATQGPDASKSSLAGNSQSPTSKEVQPEVEGTSLLSPKATATSCEAAALEDCKSTNTTIHAADDASDAGSANAASDATKENLDFQGIEDDDSGLEECILDRRKRRRDSTFLLLPKPEARQNISPGPSKSGLLLVEGLQSNASRHHESPLDHWSPNLLSKSGKSPVTAPIKEDAATPSSEESEGMETPVYLSYDVTRVNEKAILERIPESDGGGSVESSSQAEASSYSPMLRLEIQTLREEARVLRISKSTLENKLYAIRHAYEERVTPFRDVFEDMRKIRLENQAMKKEKNATRVMVEDLKKQMIVGLQSAVNKTQALQFQLDAISAQKEELEEQLRQERKEDKKI